MDGEKQPLGYEGDQAMVEYGHYGETARFLEL
jgi:hypothetical protein